MLGLAGCDKDTGMVSLLCAGMRHHATTLRVRLESRCQYRHSRIGSYEARQVQVHGELNGPAGNERFERGKSKLDQGPPEHRSSPSSIRGTRGRDSADGADSEAARDWSRRESEGGGRGRLGPRSASMRTNRSVPKSCPASAKIQRRAQQQREIDRGWLGSHKVHYAKLQFLDAVRGASKRSAATPRRLHAQGFE